MTTSPEAILGVIAAQPALQAQAAQLAERLQLPCLDAVTEGLVLRLGEEGLELLDARPGAPGAVRVDFARLGHRTGSIRSEAVARAVGLRGGEPLTVLDATAGLGRDAFVLASLGAQVRMVERSPVVAALLADGLARAARQPELAAAAVRLRLERADARALLAALEDSQRPDVVYLDPMYPEDGTKGQVKKEMQLLRRLLGPDEDIGALFEAALAAARRRVVIKRPRRAPALPGLRPSHSLEGRSTRFDVYVKPR